MVLVAETDQWELGEYWIELLNELNSGNLEDGSPNNRKVTDLGHHTPLQQEIDSVSTVLFLAGKFFFTLPNDNYQMEKEQNTLLIHFWI